MAWRLRVSATARSDIKALLRWSEEQFGAAARERYEALVNAALLDIGADPFRQGSRPVPRLTNARFYHLRHSRHRATGVAGIVTSPRHVVFYRVDDHQQRLTVIRVLHDAMEPRRHLPP